MCLHPHKLDVIACFLVLLGMWCVWMESEPQRSQILKKKKKKIKNKEKKKNLKEKIEKDFVFF